MVSITRPLDSCASYNTERKKVTCSGVLNFIGHNVTDSSPCRKFT